MSSVCPRGHVSRRDDYCDRCGVRIGGTDAGAERRVEPTEILPPLTSVVARTHMPLRCLSCGTPHVGGDVYCEGCGRDLGGGATAEAEPMPLWEAIVTLGRAGDGIDGGAASDGASRAYPLDADELHVGRGDPANGLWTHIDLSGHDGDPAVSRLHASLVREDDGSYSVVDRGSTNGTRLNDERVPLSAGVRVRLRSGDRIQIGARTTITVRRADDQTVSRGLRSLR